MGADSGLMCYQPTGPLVRTVDEVPLWIKPGIVGWIPIIGPALNVLYDWKRQKLAYKSVGEFISDNLGPGEDMRGKRVGILEQVTNNANIFDGTNGHPNAKGPSEG